MSANKTEFLPRVNCPYCGQEMVSGKIRGDGRSAVKFIRDDEEKEKGLMASLYRIFSGRMTAVKYGVGLYMFSIDTHFCENCGKMIFDTQIEN